MHGITFYGENIQDEWFIVELLFHLTKQFRGLVARVVDSDGEFMLIEAADHLPQWANPDTCMQRVSMTNANLISTKITIRGVSISQVYLCDGDLLLVQNSPSDSNTVLSVSAALDKVRRNPKLYKVPAAISDCIRARFGDSAKQQHRVTVYLPIAAAMILKTDPSLIAPVVRTFCNRDQIDLKACRAMKHFPPEVRVYADVTFTRCLYAMLTYTRYTPDRRTGWNLPAPNHETYKAHTLGMKIAAGFEILASKAAKSGDVDDLSNDKDWHLFLSRLNANQYFGENIEHSKEYTRRLQNAKEYFKMFADSRPIATDQAAQRVRKQLKELRSSHESFSADEMQEYKPIDDSDDWLNMSAEDLDKMLAERYGIKKTFQANDDVDAQTATDLTGNLQQFLNQKSEFDGIDMRPEPPKRGIKKKAESSFSAIEPTTLDESTAVTFNPDTFQHHLQEMLDFIIPEDNWDSHSDMSDFDDECIGRNIEKMGTEVPASESTESGASSLAEYMQQMDLELAGTTIGKSFLPKAAGEANGTADDSFDDIESFEPVNIDVNALRNLAESYQAQLGGHGPAASILGSLGMNIRPNPKVGTNKEEPTIFNTQV